MSGFIRRPADRELQLKFSDFKFTDSYMQQAREHISKYPQGREASAVMPLLNLVQNQMREQGHGYWVPTPAMDYVAKLLDMPEIRVYEVATFYTMYHLSPAGEHIVQVCTTTPCWLRGCDKIVKACEDELNLKVGETSQDGQFTLMEVECLGACVNAPMVQINDMFYEDLDDDRMRDILISLKKGQVPESGTVKRRSCEPFSREKVSPLSKDGVKS